MSTKSIKSKLTIVLLNNSNWEEKSMVRQSEKKWKWTSRFRKKIAKASSMMLAMAMSVSMIPTPVQAASATTVEYLNRGLSAFNTGSGMIVSWRYLASDADDAEYRLYRDGSLIYTSTSGKATCYLDTAGSASSNYYVDTVSGNQILSRDTVDVMSGNSYLQLNLSKPGSDYMPNDCSVGDVDGDGSYEIFLKWDPSNSKDNSQSGTTSNVYIDCYKLDGTRLWRIDLGKNIRAGAHYTQFLVADFDSDGKAEMTCKTADGTVDGQGNVIGDSSADYRNSSGYILSGPEYYSLFDGETGKVLDTVDYEPARGTVSSWGDKYGNRVDRFLGAVMYLDSDHPSAVTVRGYYTRMTACAYDVVNDKLVKRWYFDSNNSSSSAAKGNGNHNCMPADVDGDGKQELILGSTCIDDDGTLKWCTGKGHGDALHVGDFLPNRSGLEVWMCHESSPYGVTLMDANTGSTIFHVDNSKDTGRCCADNIWSGSDDAEFWGVGYDILNGSGTAIASNRPSINFLSYWDGDLERELLDGTAITKYTGTSSGTTTLLSGTDCTSCNSTKATPCLSADIFGDWREEVIWSTSDGNALRIYATTYTTDYRITTLMQDPQYRNQVAGQNVAYNQPPHASFYLGSDENLPQRPNVTVLGGNRYTEVTDEKTAATLTEDGLYMIKNASSGLYMEVANGEAKNGANVQQWGADEAASHNTWKVKSAGDGYYKLYSQVGDGNTYLLDVTGEKSANGTNVEIYQDSGSNAQLFKFVENNDGSYRIYTKTSNDDSCVEVINASASSGANVQQWEDNGHACQSWYLIPVEEEAEEEDTTKAASALTNNGLYMIQNVNSGLYMEVTNGTAANGINVQQWGANEAAAHNTWKAVYAGNGYYKLYSQVGDGNTYLLDLYYGKADNGTNIQIYTDTQSDAQCFKFVKTDDGLYRIYTKASKDTACVEVKNALTSSGANVQEWEDNGHDCQLWKLIPIESLDDKEDTNNTESEETPKTEESTDSSESVVTGEIEVTVSVSSDWGAGASAEFKLTNHTGANFENGWTIQLTSNREIAQLWQGEVKSLGNNTYQISNPNWDMTWENGETITIGGALGEGSGVPTIGNVTVVN